MTDEWNIDRLDLSAYLRRIDYASEKTPTAQTLARLHRAHLAAIPFENLDIVLGRGVDVELDSVQAKLVHRRRGGYCYEHALLFAAVLERLGYAVDRSLARVGGDIERPRARTHMALQVRAGAERWLADVGFGSGLLEPIVLQHRRRAYPGRIDVRAIPDRCGRLAAARTPGPGLGHAVQPR